MADRTATYEIRLKDAFSPGLKRATGNLRAFEGSTKRVATASRGMGVAIKSAIAPLAALISAGALVQGIVNIAKLGIEMEQTRVSFATMLGTVERGNALIDQLNQFSNVTPFDNQKVLQSARTLLAFGIQSKDIIPTMKLLGDVSAGTGKDLKELGVIYGQIRGAGRLMGQDLLQLINAGFNPLQIISKKTGKSMGVLKKDMEKGLISFDMVKEAFKSATSEGGLFFNLMEKQSKTVGGRISTLRGKIQLMGIALGEKLNKPLGESIQKLLELVDIIPKINFQPLIDAFSDLASSSFFAFEAIGELFGLFGPSGLTTLQKIQIGFNILAGAIRLASVSMRSFILLFRATIEAVKAFKVGGIEAAAGTFTSEIQIGINKEIQAFKDLFSLKGVVPDKKASGAVGGGGLGATGTGTGTGGAGAAGRAKLSGTLSGAGASARNIEINIEKLVETINFKTSNFKQNAAEMQEQIKRSLLMAINDVSLTAG